MTTTITSKGQVTVPKPIRDYLGLKAGSSVTFERLQNGEIALRPARKRHKTPPSPIAKLRGRATVRMSTDEIMEMAALNDKLAINAVIYSELSISFQRIEELEAILVEGSISAETIPREALFLAGKAFLSYRKRQGTRQSVLPDFCIGAHAAVTGATLLTRDTSRSQSYFPKVRLIGPSAVQ